MIFHVTGSENAARIDVFESGKDFFGITLGYVGDNVEASAMAHAHDEFAGSEARASIEEFVD